MMFKSFVILLVQCLISVQCSSSQVPDQLDGSGSGDDTVVPLNSNFPIKAEDDMGSGGDSTTQKSSRVFNTDDEDGDDITFSGDLEIVDIESSGDGEDKISVLLGARPEADSRVKCSHSGLYCWCADRSGKEVVDTRVLIEFGNFEKLKCDEAPFVLEIAPTEKVKTKMPNPATSGRKTTSSVDLPYIVDKEKPTEHEIGVAGGRGGREGLEFGSDGSDAHPKKAFTIFTHPGILAAIIGGGVVTLLCSMLLIMFIVYRMRKKDEGSYPIDADSKPQRLHTYTRAPNKEFYA